MVKFETIPKFVQLADFLEQEIINGNFNPGTKLPSERALSKKYNLSYLTVNKAVATLVSRGLLQRQLGRNGTSVIGPQRRIGLSTVGAVIEADPRMNVLFSHHLLSFLQEKGYLVSLFDLRRAETLTEHLSLFLAESPRALVVDAPSGFPFRTLERVPPSTKLIFLHRFEGSRERKYDASYVLSDYRRGGYLAVRHLLKTGRKRIGIVSFEIQPGWTSDLVYQGCLDAFKEFSTKALEYVNSQTAGKADYERLLAKRPDAIFSFGDSRIGPVLAMMEKRGIGIPDDVAIVGYFNTRAAEAYGLTSVSIREESLVNEAVGAIETKDRSRIQIEPELVFRRSCPEIKEAL